MREWLRKARTDKGMTQLQLAKSIGISEGYYSYIESGDRQKNMDIAMVMKLARALDMSTQEIMEQEAVPA